MTRPLSYARSWFRSKRRPTELWPIERARAAHDAGAAYAVLVDSPDRPRAFLEVTPRYVGVSFLDERLREHLVYDFQLAGPGRLFLTAATHREFDGDSDRVSAAAAYMFDPSGAVRIRRRPRMLDDPRLIETAASTTDVRGNAEPYPAFGAHDGLLRVERDRPA